MGNAASPFFLVKRSSCAALPHGGCQMCGSVRALDPGVRRAARVAIPRHVLLPTGRVPKALRPSGVAPSGTRVASPGTVTANPATLVSPAVASATVATRLHGALLNITLACFSLGLA